MTSEECEGVASRQAAFLLLRWRQAKRQVENDRRILSAGLQLLSSQTRGLEQHALERLATELNVSWHQIPTEGMQFALAMTGKSKSLQPDALRLLRYSLETLETAFANSEHDVDPNTKMTIPLSAGNSLLDAMASALASAKDDDSSWNETLADVRLISLYLFELPTTLVTSEFFHSKMLPSFQLYRPQTNTWKEFMDKIMPSLLSWLEESHQKNAMTCMMVLQLTHAFLCVLHELLRTQLNSKKVFVALTKTWMTTLVNYRHSFLELMTAADSQTSYLDGDALSANVDMINKTFVGILLDSEHIPEYEAALELQDTLWTTSEEVAEENSDPPTKKQKKSGKKSGKPSLLSYQRGLFQELVNLLQDEANTDGMKASVGSLLDVLASEYTVRLRSYKGEGSTSEHFKSNKKRSATVIGATSSTRSPFKFWAELCAAAVVGCKKSHKSVLVQLYDSLFQALANCEIYRVTEDTGDQNHYTKMEKITRNFLELVQNEDREAAGQFAVIANALRASPNVLEKSLTSVLVVLGHNVSSGTVLPAACSCWQNVLEAYESMRLLDKLFEAIFGLEAASDEVYAGLYTLLRQDKCDEALRGCMRRLPVGQIDAVWELCAEHLQTKEKVRGSSFASKVRVVRVVLQALMQEIQITPQTRKKLETLLTTSTKENLFDPLVAMSEKAMKHPSKAHLEVKELLAVFGELLVLYDDVSSVVQKEVFDPTLHALQSSGTFATSIQKLLQSTSKKKSSGRGNDNQKDTYESGLIKIGIHFLRKEDEMMTNHAEIADAVVTFAVKSDSWEAITFYLWELTTYLSQSRAKLLLQSLLEKYLGRDVTAMNILQAAAFYEIQALRNVASPVLVKMGDTCLKNLTQASTDEKNTALVMLDRYFGLLRSLPEGYLPAEECADLLRLGFESFEATNNLVEMEESAATTAQILQWLVDNYLPIRTYADETAAQDVDDRAYKFIVYFQADAHKASQIAMLACILQFHLYECASPETKIASAVKSFVRPKKKGKSHGAIQNITLVLEALANIERTQESEAGGTINDVEQSIIAEVSKGLGPEGYPTSGHTNEFALMSALVRYCTSMSTLGISAEDSPLGHIVKSNLESSLNAALQSLTSPRVQGDDEIFTHYVALFEATCKHYHTIRSICSPTMFSCLLAVAMFRVADPSVLEEEEVRVRPLQALLFNANKTEFQLALTVIGQEIRAQEASRVVAALRTLVVLLQGEKRELTTSRKKSLQDFKTALMESIMSLLLASSNEERNIDVCLWSLQALSLVYTTPELFSWTSEELAHVSLVLQPLSSVASSQQRRQSKLSIRQLHVIWMSSYSLLMRIVRHHLSSMVHAIPLIVEAVNSLLQIVVTTSRKRVRNHSFANEASATTEEQYVQEWSSNLARLYGYLKAHDVQVRKHVVYMILSYVRAAEKEDLPTKLQHRLRPGIFVLLDICSTNEKEQLYAALDATGKSLLKNLDNSYKLNYRYVGKV